MGKDNAKKSAHGRAPIATIVIGLILLVPVFVVLASRHSIETEYDSVEIVVDYYQLLDLANAEDFPIQVVLSKLESSGIEALALMEDTPRNLEARGLCNVIHGSDWLGFHSPEEKKIIKALGGVEPDVWDIEGVDFRLLLGLDPTKTHLIFRDEVVGAHVSESAVKRYMNRASSRLIGEFTVLSISGEETLVYDSGLGFNTDLPENLTAAGFRVVPRFRNDRYFTSMAIDEMLGTVLTNDAFQKGMIFDGDEILGYPSHLTNVQNAIRDTGSYFGWIEFAKQAGETTVAKAIPENTVRVHSIEDKEMEVYTPAKAVARFTRAVRERGMRLLYLKPFRYPHGADNIEKSIAYFKAVRESVEAEGMRIGPPSTFGGNESEWTDPSATWARVLIGLYILLVGTYVLACNQLNRFKWIGLVPVGLAIIVAVILFAMPDSSLSGNVLKILALIAALAFPVLGISELVKSLSGEKQRKGTKRALALWGMTILFALLGGLIIAALLSERDYMLQINAFSGVKLALVVPIIAAIVLGVRLVIPSDRAGNGLIGDVRFLLDFPLQAKHLAGFLIIAAAGILILMRSGNEPLLGVGEMEASIRLKLEQMLIARPRTKEFLIGYPLLLAGILWHLNGRRVLGYLGIVAGSVGLASVVNTFCHIHIPIYMSLLRTFWGIILGLVIGLIIVTVVEILIDLFSGAFKEKEKVDDV